jgi:transposase-like protein
MKALSDLLARLEYGCGHFALVSLVHIKGESPRQRRERVEREKVGAFQRPCDFCGPTYEEPMVAVELVGNVAHVPGSTSSDALMTEGHGHGPALIDGVNRHQTPKQEEAVTTTPTDSEPTDTPSTDDAPTAEPGDRTQVQARAVVVRRRLDRGQEQEVVRLYATTDTPVGEIARQFGVGQTSVYRIAKRNSTALRNPGLGRSTASGSATAADGGGVGLKAEASSTPTQSEWPNQSSSRTMAPRGIAPIKRRASAAADSRSAGAVAANRSVASTSHSTGLSTTGGVQRRFVVGFIAERVVDAETIREAIAQAEALGATDITSVTKVD